jgi:hypothetical protein
MEIILTMSLISAQHTSEITNSPIQHHMKNTSFGKILLVAAAAVFGAGSIQASVIWDLNPSDSNAPVGSSSHTFTSSGFSITAYGFDNHSGIGTAHNLYYKNIPPVGGAAESGLGLTNIPDNELQAGLHFIQFDFTAALAAGMFNGQLSVASVQPSETFAIFGSNTLGTLGTQVGGVFGSSSDNQFVSIAGFGQFHFYSVMALTDDVLPSAIRADLPAVPEMSAFFPIVGLLTAIGSTHLLRRRRQARRTSEQAAI